MTTFIWDFFAWVGIFTAAFSLIHHLRWGSKMKQAEAYMAVARRERILCDKWQFKAPEKALEHISNAVKYSKMATDIFDQMEKK